MKQFKDQSDSFNKQTFNNKWNELSNFIKRGQTQNGNFSLIYSHTPHANFIVEKAQDNSTRATGSYSYIVGNKLNIQNSRELFIGYTQAYEFHMQSDSHIKKRRKDEKISLGKIRSEWEEKLGSLQTIFDETTQKFREDTEFLVDRTQRWSSLKNYSINKEFEKLSNTYSDFMKLKDPVQYWKGLAEDYKNSGYWWVAGLFTSSIITTIIIVVFFYNPPDSFSANFFGGDPLAVKNVILFATLISVAAYSIRTCAKMAYSSFHLRRDAKEREQLTLVYLALTQEGSVSENERDLVLNSIFRRSETGLIKNEVNPEGMLPAWLRKFN